MARRNLEPKQEPAGEDEVGVAAVNRALSLLDTFSKEQLSFTLAQMAERTGLYKSTILRLAESLEAYGYLRRGEGSVFTLGPTPFRLATLYQRNLHPAELVMPVLRNLVELTEESATFYVISGDKRLCAYRANSPLAITDNVQAGEMRPLERGAGGKVLLAFVGRQGPEFDTIREEMFSLSRGELYEGIVSLASPVFGSADKLEGAISISGPATRLGKEAIARIKPHLFRASQHLTELFGGDGSRYEVLL
ncbi:transcriptional regulator IclR family (plasmid) [Cupriavidus necator N-1]|uniref:Transcriptional regulator IclR family n=1 Tax=Cupriavidus necator (strain ATCC 43291 / DSM 13513 / CCUG 52238 / LMG 8453 / N-1) TaxID=1042878 RepID=F8GYM0_CUPNN|nr:IclR family transcriptional regulator [Cupriavidus necator]AEI82961.1 transcriptional regulator IclR family [Cupriavidus necator N-1]MDX6008748.1 IclR family transcriptional regulator [Cupriavidus necator]